MTIHSVSSYQNPQQYKAEARAETRQKEEAANDTKRTRGENKKEKRTDKGNFTPLWQDNASMRNTIEKKSNASGSGLGEKLNELIERLEAQKEFILEQKNSLIERTLEKGGDLDQIVEPLSGFDEQIEEINEQISNILAKQAERLAEKIKNTAAEEKNTEKTEPSESSEDVRILELSDLAAQMGKSDILLNAKTQVEGEGKVSLAQLGLDKFRVEARMLRRKVEAAISGEPISKPEMRSMLNARKTYSRQMREVARETQAASDRLSDMAAQNTGEVLEGLRPASPEKEGEPKANHPPQEAEQDRAE
ncbi:hypothetical protein LJC49_08350 [Ruminococcaceae bacterium OttesenSCG-928-I18]|nr:hypothetical protein [Ruminococcaceae bacterium OttesenSCG-928-I18]